VPLPVAELRRGRICYAVYPFASQFPAELADGREIADVDRLAREFKGAPVALSADVRLRPVLLLHDGTRGDHGDLAALRINSVKERHRESDAWKRITSHEHPLFFHLPQSGRYGLPLESVIAITSVGTIHKSAVPDIRPVGELNIHEMQTISERLARALSLDMAPMIARKARELLCQAGLDL